MDRDGMGQTRAEADRERLPIASDRSRGETG